MPTVKQLVPAPVRRVIHRARVKRAIRTFQPYLCQHDYRGTRLRMWISDPMAAGWYDRDYVDEDMLPWLAEHGVARDGLVFDLGAHHGLYAMMLAARLVPEGRVVAVEAEAHNVEVARHNVAMNGYAGRVEIVHAAAGDRDGAVRFTEGLNGKIEPGARLGTVEVPMLTVDTLTERYGPPSAVVVDVEGYEQRVLQGASRTLAEHTPALEIEVHADWQLQDVGGSVSGLLGLLRGYALAAEDGGVYKPSEAHHHLLASGSAVGARTALRAR